MAGRRTRLLGGALLLTLAGCASLWRSDDPREPSPRDRLVEAATLLDRGDFRAAQPLLSWVYSRCPTGRPGRDALLLMSAAELDPRNDARRLDVGAALAAEYLALAAAPVDGKPLAKTLYLLGVELGGEAPARVPVAAVDTVLTDACPPAQPAAAPRAVARGPAAAPTDTTPAAAFRPTEATWLPELPGPTVPQRLAAMRAQRDSVSAQMAALVEQVRQLQERVASQQQEIERIRRTLRP